MVKPYAHKLQGTWLKAEADAAIGNAAHRFNGEADPLYARRVADTHKSEAQRRAEAAQASAESAKDKIRAKRQYSTPAPVLKPRSQQGRRPAPQSALTFVENKIATLIERVVETTQAALVTAYEGQITKLERERLLKQEQLQQLSARNGKVLPDYNESSRTILQFLLNPLIYWASGNIKSRRLVAKLAFAEELIYDRENGFSNPKTTLPFQLIQSLNSNRKENTMQIEEMVPPHGTTP